MISNYVTKSDFQRLPYQIGLAEDILRWAELTDSIQNRVLSSPTLSEWRQEMAH